MQLGKWYRDRANATVSKLEAARGQIESAGMVRAADSGRFGRMDGRQCVLPVTVRAATHHDVGYERRETRVSISARYAAPLWNARLLTLCVALCVPETANEPPGGGREQHASWVPSRGTSSRTREMPLFILQTLRFLRLNIPGGRIKVQNFRKVSIFLNCQKKKKKKKLKSNLECKVLNNITNAIYHFIWRDVSM